MRLLLIGAPGAGKGTQAKRLAERFSITHISSGDLLRQHIQDQTSLGRKIKAYVDAGDLVPDAMVMDMLRKPVVAAVESGGYVLDGFPRTVDQAKAAFDVAHELGVEVQAAVHLDVPDDELIRRLLARGRGADDTEEVISHRLQVYREKTIPLLDYYAGREWMFTVDGTQSPDQVHQDIGGRLRKLAAFDTVQGQLRSRGSVSGDGTERAGMGSNPRSAHYEETGAPRVDWPGEAGAPSSSAASPGSCSPPPTAPRS
jgi:adenylate kinase